MAFAIFDKSLAEEYIPSSGKPDEFLNSLNSGQFQKIQTYYESLPKMKHDIEYTCPKCGETKKETLEGLASFFASA